MTEVAAALRDTELPLAGALSVEVESQLEAASSPWLVVHLHTLKNGGLAKLQAALAAVARLHAATSADLSATARAALWTRVLTSRMMALPLRESDPDVQRFIRFVYEPTNGGVRVLLDWTGVKIDALVCPLLSEFLKMERSSGVPPLVVGVVLSRCRLSSHTIGMLDEVLSEAKRASQQLSLVDLRSLERLDLSHNGLLPDALKTLATLLDRHEVRGVRLENALALADSMLTVDAVKAVLQSVFSPTTGHRSPVSVSLAHNSLDPRYYRALSEALEAKTRPLRRLSLSRTLSVFDSDSREECWTWIASIMLSRQGTEIESELDISGNPFYPQDSTCFRHRVELLYIEHLVLVRRALDQQIPVSCRVSTAAASHLAPSDDSATADILDPTVQYPVRAMAPNGYALVVVEDCTPASRWVKRENLATLEIAGATILCHQPRFESLVLDNMRVNAPLYQLLAVVGTELRRLSLHGLDVSDIVARLPTFCPRISHLNLEACRLTSIQELIMLLIVGRGAELRSMTLNCNGLGVRSAAQLAELYHAVPELRLRHLQLKKCHIGARGLIYLDEILRTSRYLEVVDLDRIGRRGNDAEEEDSEYAARREALTTRYENCVIRVEPLPIRTRLAFLSIGSTVETIKSMDAPVASLVLEFAATPVVRHLLWS